VWNRPPVKDFRGQFGHKSGGPLRILIQEVSASVSTRRLPLPSEIFSRGSVKARLEGIRSSGEPFCASRQSLMMKAIQLMWFVSLLKWAIAVPASSNSGCLCLAGQSCWPSASQWDTFNSSVGGRLTVITPVGAPCHDPTFNSEVCGDVVSEYTNSTWRSDQIGTSSVLFSSQNPFSTIPNTNF